MNLILAFCLWAQFFFGLSTALRIDGSSLVDANGNVVQLKGVNSFGMNNQQTMLDGMWSNNALSGDFATVVRRQKLLGFNAVRIPFSFKDFELAPRSFIHRDCKLPSDKELARSVTPPGTPLRGPAPKLPNPPPLSAYANNVCNAYLPSSSVRERLIYIVKFYIQNGFVVMLDNHLREDQTALQSPEKWIRQWTDLARDLVMNDPLVRENLLIDLLNEPDNYGVSWDTLTGLYISAMDAIDRAVGGNIMFAVEGTGQAGINANWGDGFATDRVEELGLGDPRPFFNLLLSKPYRNRVILAPHVYGPSVTFNDAGTTGSALYDRLNLSFGSKSRQPGYCNGGDCQTFPIAVGEFGSKLEQANDIRMMNDFAGYMTDTSRRFSWFWWSWQANSGDTGGLVDDGWINIVWKKIDLLEKFGLQPWYTGSRDGGLDEPLALPPAPPQPEPSPVPPILPPFTVEPPPVPPPSPSAPPSPPPPPSPTPAPQVPPPQVQQPPASPSSSCAVRVEYTPTWPISSDYFGTVLNIFVSNTGDEAVPTPWQLRLSADPYDQVVSAWNWDPTVVDGAIVGTASQSWLVMQPSGQEYNIGLIIRGTSDVPLDYLPASVQLNGVDCALQASRIAH